MRHSIVLLLVLTAIILPLMGCQESESTQIQRARLVASENIKLKQQIAAKDKEIAALNKDIARLEKEKAKTIEDAGNANIKVLQIVNETEIRAKQLEEENKKLKEEIATLKGQ